MVLASQLARPDALRRFASRRRRHTFRNLALSAALAGALGFWFWPGDKPVHTIAQPPEPATATPADQTHQLAAASAGAASARVEADRAAQQRRIAEAAAAQDAFLRQLRGDTRSQPGIDARTALDAPRPAPGLVAPASEGASLEIGRRSPALIKPAGDEPRQLASAAIVSPAPAVSATSQLAAQLTFTTPDGPNTAGAALRQGMSQIADGKYVEGRRTLSRVLTGGDPALTRSDAQTIRDTLASVNKSLVFSDRSADDDPLAVTHTIASGELLSTIARKYKITYQFLEQINNIDARRIRVGQKIKAINGPFHVIVDKSDYRMDIFAKETDGAAIYIRSFTVGVGKDDSTPVGAFICRQGGKLENPSWTHPRTGKFFGSDDAANPIGEYWIALEGTDEHTKGVRGYGIHGTIEPDSIGKQASLGCVRMLAKDVEQVYKLLVDGHSTVSIQP